MCSEQQIQVLLGQPGALARRLTAVGKPVDLVIDGTDVHGDLLPGSSQRHIYEQIPRIGDVRRDPVGEVVPWFGTGAHQRRIGEAPRHLLHVCSTLIRAVAIDGGLIQ